jgi:hypothetical protein
MLSQKEDEALSKLASLLGANKQDLYDVIQFESGWNPQISNMRGSTAKGLIQFVDNTARDLKYVDEYGSVKKFTSSQDLIARNPTIEDQLRVVDNKLSSPKNGPVAQYFSQHLSRVSSPDMYDIAASIFMPAAIGRPDDDLASMLKYQKDRDNFPIQNPGISTMRDYVSKVIKGGKGGGNRHASASPSKGSTPAAIQTALAVGSAITNVASNIVTNKTPTGAAPTVSGSPGQSALQPNREIIIADGDTLKKHLDAVKSALTAQNIS